MRTFTRFIALNLCEKRSTATSTHLMLAKQVLASAAHYSQMNRRTDSSLEGSCSSIRGTSKVAVAAVSSSHEPQWLPAISPKTIDMHTPLWGCTKDSKAPGGLRKLRYGHVTKGM